MSVTDLTTIMANPAGKPFGIRVELPTNDPMSAPHLLGADWSAMEGMLKQPGYYRKGDTPSVRLTKVSAG